MYISDMNDIPANVMALIEKEFSKWKEPAPTTIKEMVDFICEAGDFEEETDYCYIHRNYSCDIGDYIFQATGSSYRKDQCVCEEEMDYESITITTHDDIQVAELYKSFDDFEKSCISLDIDCPVDKKDIELLIEAKKFDLL